MCKTPCLRHCDTTATPSTRRALFEPPAVVGVAAWLRGCQAAVTIRARVDTVREIRWTRDMALKYCAHRMSRDAEKDFPELVAAVHKRTRPLSAISGTNAAQLQSAALKGKVIDELEPGARLDLPFALAKNFERKVYRCGMGSLATFDTGTDRNPALNGL